MSRFKTVPIAAATGDARIVFKRKGSKVRYIDPTSAKVGPWTLDPAVHAQATSLPETFNPLAHIVPNVDAYKRMTVPELRALAGNKGLKVPSKWRKADIIIALTETR